MGGPLAERRTTAVVVPGVNYIVADELPGATLVIRDTSLAIEDSLFQGLSYFGQGALVLANANVTFLNTTFAANNNSAGVQAPPHTMLSCMPGAHAWLHGCADHDDGTFCAAMVPVNWMCLSNAVVCSTIAWRACMCNKLQQVSCADMRVGPQR